MRQGSTLAGRRLAGLCLSVIGMGPFLVAAEAPVGSSLSGSLSVSANGAATYQLPLLTPPGVIKPSLSFQYSSQNGNGPLGVGWSLGGLAQISRCPRTKMVDGVDGNVVQFNANDRLCLDGQRLILKSGSAYGANAAEYRTQMESDSKIVGHGDFASGTAWFQVWTKSGEVLEFGNTANSRLSLTPAGGSAAVPYTWSLNRASDRFSNYYTVTYLQDNRMLYPQSIQYAGNSQAGTAPGRTLSFDWTPATPRPDPMLAYLGAGVSGSIRYRLSSISNNANPARYKLVYSLSGAGLSNLTRINYCPDGTDNNCLKVESQYGYDKDTATGERMSARKLVLETFGKDQGWKDQNTHPRQLADVNGDGRQDIVGFANEGVYVAFGTATGFTASSRKLSGFNVSAGWTSNKQFPRMVADVNGDGLADIVGFASSGVYVSLSTGEGFTAPTLWRTGYGTDSGWSDQDAYPRTLADVDGDGLLDVVGFSASTVSVSLNKRNKFQSSPELSELNAFTPPSGWKSNGTQPRMVTDVNGDGRADLIGLSTDGIYVSLSSAAGFSNPARWNNENWARVNTPRTIDNGQGGDVACGSSETWGGGSERITTDFNGDGLVDILGFNVQSTRFPAVVSTTRKGDVFKSCVDDARTEISATSTIYISLNSGKGFSPRTVIGSEFPPIDKMGIEAAYDYLSKLSRQVTDMNADDRGDIVSFNGACTGLQASNGTGLRAETCLVDSYTPETGGWGEPHPRMIADVNGDGTADIVGFGNGGAYISYGTAKFPNQVLSFKTDLTESAITYSTLADAAVYKKGTGSAFPIADLQFPMPVVKSLSNPDGLGGTNLTHYRYGGLRTHFDYGSLGFQWQEVMDPTTGALSYSEYKQGFPLTGALSRTQSQRCTGMGQMPWSGCELLSQEVSEWTVSESGATADRKVYRPAITKTIEHSWLKNSSTP